MFKSFQQWLPGVVLVVASAAPCFGVCSTTTAEEHQCWEKQITLSNVSCANIYQDLKVKVTLTSGSSTRSTYAYWDGGNALKFRMEFPSQGTWTWTSTCEANELGVNNCGCAMGHSLSNQTVSVGAAPMAISTRIYPRVNDVAPGIGRYFKGTFGDPFFWLGDTTWSGPHKSTRAEWATYLADRASDEFSVVQVALPSAATTMPLDAADPGVAGDIARAPFEQIPGCVNPTPNDPVPNHCSRWIPAFWQEWARRLEEANEAGLVAAVVGLMEGPIERKGGTWCAPRLEYSKIYARNVAARLAGSAVVLSPGFDRYSGSSQCPCYDPNQSGASCTAGKPGPVATRIEAVGAHLATVVPHVLLTNHTGAAMPPGEILAQQDKPWLDFQLFQSGQGGYVTGNVAADQLNEVLCKARDWPLCIWRRNCATFTPARANGQLCPATITGSPVASQIKPGINGESLYDGESHNRFGATNYTPYTVRRTAWLSLVDGAAGYTYGNLEIYPWTNYVAGLARPSNDHMAHIANLFNHHISWQTLVPQPEKIANNTGTTELTRMALAHNATNTELLAYLPNNPEIHINYTTLGSLPKAGRWYDPRTGQFLNTGYSQGNLVSGQVWKFCRPCGTVTCTLPPGTPARPSCPASGSPGSAGADYVLVIP